MIPVPFWVYTLTCFWALGIEMTFRWLAQKLGESDDFKTAYGFALQGLLKYHLNPSAMQTHPMPDAQITSEFEAVVTQTYAC